MLDLRLIYVIYSSTLELDYYTIETSQIYENNKMMLFLEILINIQIILPFAPSFKLAEIITLLQFLISRSLTVEAELLDYR